MNGQAGGATAGIAAVRRIYDLLVTEDVDAALKALGPGFEWAEPELPGHPLAGVHRGADGIETGVVTPLRELCAELAVEPDEFIDGDGHVVVTGAVRGRWKDNETEWRAPFAHVWELDGGGVPVRVRAYGDTGGLGVAAARRELSELADVLAEQATAIRRQWVELGDSGTPIQWDSDDAPPAPVATLSNGAASARLVAVDMAQDGSAREEVERYLEEELGPEEAAAVADQIFPSVVVADPVEAQQPAGPRWARRFPRNRS
jgi:ketosteroid isomerase-like protein